ncbi:MAG: hypothetical protein Q7T45_13940 [Bradyrhizobium sp.]|uniref:hypothetical protein n=1 Tax=Bradyrhizobium sp. TaxID=376 RepID=UPI00272302D4|nr:hypothetical protein [Bradyrhizobium sp.]MDO8398913.1 hypothetical protein [Bradyrhizobium sp.]
MTTKEITELLERPTITPDQLLKSRILPLSRNGIYDAILRGEIDVITIGRKKAVITASLRKKLGMVG